MSLMKTSRPATFLFLREAELVPRLDRVDGVAARVGEPDHLRFRGLSLEQERRHIGRIERMAYRAKHLAAVRLDNLRGVLFKGVVGVVGR